MSYLIDLINQNIRKISMVVLGFSLLLLIIAIALINNTIRLSVFSKRFVIRSMQLVGATRGFIMRPFIWQGISTLHFLPANPLRDYFRQR